MPRHVPRSTPGMQIETLDRGQAEAHVRRLYPALTAMARARLRNSFDAQDAVQEAATRVLKNLDSYDPTSPFDRWVFAIAANVMRDMARRKRTRQENAPTRDEEILLDPHRALEREEDLDRIRKSISAVDSAVASWRDGASHRQGILVDVGGGADRIGGGGRLRPGRSGAGAPPQGDGGMPETVSRS